MHLREEASLVALTMAAASADAMTWLGLGHVFPANMTGNTVLLGIGLATADHGAVLRSAVALCGFVAGAALGGTFRGGRVLLYGSAAESLLLLGATGSWIALGAPTGVARVVIVGLMGAAMGVQSASVTRLQVGISATYITGTWTAVSRWLGGRLRQGPESDADADPQARARQRTVVASYFATAIGAAFLYHGVGAPAVAVPAGLACAVAVACAV